MSGKSSLGEFQRWLVKYRINDVVKEEPRLVAVTDALIKSYLEEFQRWLSNQSDYSPSISFQLTKHK